MTTGRGESPSRARGSLAGLAGVALLLYGLLTLFIASAWGPGNSDELVSGGVELVPWFGLPCIGTVAASHSAVSAARRRPAGAGLLIAAACLASWTAFAFAVAD